MLNQFTEKKLRGLRQGVAPQSRALCQLWDCVPGHAGGQFPIPDWASADVWTLYPVVCQCWLNLVPP